MYIYIFFSKIHVYIHLFTPKRVKHSPLTTPKETLSTATLVLLFSSMKTLRSFLTLTVKSEALEFSTLSFSC